MKKVTGFVLIQYLWGCLVCIRINTLSSVVSFTVMKTKQRPQIVHLKELRSGDKPQAGMLAWPVFEGTPLRRATAVPS
ncbi:hypothetical protein MHYP_G00063330 [Metynnis hypsauchen]